MIVVGQRRHHVGLCWLHAAGHTYLWRALGCMGGGSLTGPSGIGFGSLGGGVGQWGGWVGVRRERVGEPTPISRGFVSAILVLCQLFEVCISRPAWGRQ